MITAPDRVRQRSLALAILTLLVFLFAWGVVFPIVVSWAAFDEELDQSRRLLSAYQHVAVLRPQILQLLADREREEASLAGLWPGTTSSAAAAELQAEVRRLVEAAGGQVQSVQPIPIAEESGFGRIGVHVDLTVPMAAFPALLKVIDGHAPFLLLDKIAIHAPESLGKGGPLLTIRWDVIGYSAVKSA